MSSKLQSLAHQAITTRIDPRILVIILTLALFVLGAGAPIASGGVGGN